MGGAFRYKPMMSRTVSTNRGSVHGSPFLALPGLLAVKDGIMLGAAMLTMADSAKAYLRRIGAAN
jgi:uncharacterized membrane protein YkgB